MMWMRLPETRRFLARLMTKEVEAAIDRDCELMLLAGDIASAASWHPVMCPAPVPVHTALSKAWTLSLVRSCVPRWDVEEAVQW